MNALPNELRLSILILTNVLLALAAYRFVRALTGKRGWSAAMDVLLLDYLVQYVSVCLPGVLGILTVETMLGTALGLSALMWWASRTFTSGSGLKQNPDVKVRLAARDFLIGIGVFFLLGYFSGMIYVEFSSTLFGDDALMYHLPIPAIWLHDHHLTFFTTWFSNPANSYSPLAVETFIEWLLAPIGNDLLAHFVQMPALLLIYFASIELLSAIGVKNGVAALLAIAAIVSRPFVSQAILVKDDLFVAAFFMVMLAGCSQERLKDRFGPWRAGIAAGLFFATKYTALQTAPLLLLVIDAPFRAGWKWRQWGVALLCMTVIAAPWYVRNIVLTGNPLYTVPLQIGGVQVFKGLFFPSPSEDLRTFHGIMKTLTTGYQGLAPSLLLLSIVIWFAALILKAKKLNDPIMRICLLGPLLGMLLFFFVSHAPEIRYAYPSLVLLFIAGSIAIDEIPGAMLIAAVLMSCFLLLGFRLELVPYCLIPAVCVAIGGELCRRFALPHLKRRGVAIGLGVAGLALLSGLMFVYWNAEIIAGRGTMLAGLSELYPDLTPVWASALENTPDEGTIAYTNIAMVRPLMGFDYTHQIIYVPTRPGVTWCHDLPASNEHVAEPKFREFVAKLLMTDPDQKIWLDHLLASGARCIVIGKQPYMENPPELSFAEQDSAHFQRVFDNEKAAVYRITP